MLKTIIADTSCLIVLTKIGELELLYKLFGSIYTTHIIANEYGETLPSWIQVLDVEDKNSQLVLELQLDAGESSAIALALEYQNASIILDDNKARKVAAQLGLNYIGTLGVILNAKKMKIIPAVKPILEKLNKTNFRISDKIISKILNLAEE